MKVLSRALRSVGEPVPFPYPLPVNLHRGDLVELLAAPRVGKSMLALNLAVAHAQRGEPVLYHSTDTRMWALAARVVSILTGEPTRDVEGARDYWSGWLSGVELPIRWSSAPIHDGNFQELLDAEREYMGEYPSMVFIDVAQDMMRGGDDENSSVMRVFRSLHAAADKTSAVIYALHHVKKGDAADGDTQVFMTDGLYGSDRIVEIVITMWRPAPGRLDLHLAKNRQGPDGMTIPLHVDYSRAAIYA